MHQHRARSAIVVFAAAVLCAFVIASSPPAAAIDAPAVTGRVTFESTGILGAEVQLLSAGIVVGSTTTTATGAYELAAPAPGTFDVRVTPPAVLGVMAQTIRGLVVPAAPTVATADVALRRPLGSVLVRLVDASGSPLPGMRVRLVTTTGGVSVVDLAVSDTTGRVDLRAPVGVDYGIRVDALSGSPASVPVDVQLRVDQFVQSTSAGTEVLLTVPTGVIDVTTTRSGPAAADGVVVSASAGGSLVDLGGGLTGSASFRSVGTTSTSGEVSLPVVGTSVDVSARPNGLLLGSSASVTITSNPTAVTLALPDAPTATRSLTLLDAAGAPVPGATVRSTTSASTDAAGTASVLVRTDQFTSVSVEATGDGTLDLPDRLLYSRRVALGGADTLRPTLADLEVTVVDEITGDPVDGALVSVSGPSIPDGDWFVRSIANSRRTGPTGVVSFRLVPGGEYGIAASVGFFRIGTDKVTLTAGGTAATVRLPPPPVSTPGFFPATVTGRITTPGGDGIEGLTVSSTVGGTSGTTDADGGFSFRVGAVRPHGLRITGSRLLLSNGRSAEVPDRLDVGTGPAFTLSPTLDDVDLGTIVLPIDRLDVQVTDETGGGLFAVLATSPLAGTRTTTTIGGSTVALFASSGYVDDGVRLDRFGEGTMHLFTGSRQITIAENSLLNFPDIDFPVTEPATLTDGPDLLRLVLTRRYGSPVTTLTGSPLVATAPLTLELPDAVVTPIVELPGPLLGATTSTQVVLARPVLVRRALTDDRHRPEHVLRGPSRDRAHRVRDPSPTRAGHVSHRHAQLGVLERCSGRRAGGVPALDARAGRATRRATGARSDRHGRARARGVADAALCDRDRRGGARRRRLGSRRRRRRRRRGRVGVDRRSRRPVGHIDRHHRDRLRRPVGSPVG